MLMYLIFNFIEKAGEDNIFVFPIIIASILAIPLAVILDIALLPIELIIGIIAIIKK